MPKELYLPFTYTLPVLSWYIVAPDSASTTLNSATSTGRGVSGAEVGLEGAAEVGWEEAGLAGVEEEEDG